MNFDLLSDLNSHAQDNLRRIHMLADTIEGQMPEAPCDLKCQPTSLIQIVESIKFQLTEQSAAISRLERHLFPQGPQTASASTLRV